jgi:hypothetical protein
MTFNLDYSRRSDIDDTVGYWFVEPTGRASCRVFYSCECKLRGWVPTPVYNMLTKEALKKVGSATCPRAVPWHPRGCSGCPVLCRSPGDDMGEHRIHQGVPVFAQCPTRPVRRAIRRPCPRADARHQVAAAAASTASKASGGMDGRPPPSRRSFRVSSAPEQGSIEQSVSRLCSSASAGRTCQRASTGLESAVIPLSSSCDGDSCGHGLNGV